MKYKLRWKPATSAKRYDNIASSDYRHYPLRLAGLKKLAEVHSFVIYKYNTYKAIIN